MTKNNQNETDPILSAARDFPEIATPRHERRLRTALLANRQFRRGGFLNFFNPNFMKNFSKIAVGATIALVFSLGIIPVAKLQAAKAEAREIVEQSQNVVANLSASEIAAIEKSLNADLGKSLAEARAAPDLKFVGEIDLKIEAEKTAKMLRESLRDGTASISEDGTTVMIQKSEGSEKKNVIGHSEIKNDFGKVKMLEYTNPAGQKVTLGLDENDIPVLKLIEI